MCQETILKLQIGCWATPEHFLFFTQLLSVLVYITFFPVQVLKYHCPECFTYIPAPAHLAQTKVSLRDLQTLMPSEWSDPLIWMRCVGTRKHPPHPRLLVLDHQDWETLAYIHGLNFFYLASITHHDLSLNSHASCCFSFSFILIYCIFIYVLNDRSGTEVTLWETWLTWCSSYQLLGFSVSTTSTTVSQFSTVFIR